MSKKLCCGPGYATPLDAMHNGNPEKLLYVIAVQPNLNDLMGDYLATIDVDPQSDTYSQVIYRTFTNRPKDELHHSGWNACSSCHLIKEGDLIPKRDKLVLPCLNSNNIYILDVGLDPRKPEIFKFIDGQILLDNDVSAPHTSHCLADGNIMISTMGDRNGNAKGEFILFNNNYECIGTWTKGNRTSNCGYDYWYQPYFNTMASTEWSAPNMFKNGFNPSDIADKESYGRRINFYDWSDRKLMQTIDLGDEGVAPLEVRFLHNPKECQGYVGTALFANVYRFHRPIDGDTMFTTEKVIDVPAIKVDNWLMADMQGMITDILLSLDDKYLYFSNWLHGDVRQYDISVRDKPRLVGQVFVGGILLNDPKVKLSNPNDTTNNIDSIKPVTVKGRRLYGGPQMLQLSLDGKRLYVSSSLYSPWDKQFYPEMVRQGGTIIQLDVNQENGGLTVNENFIVDFGTEPNGPTLAHEMRYPGGDCTSDIWLVDED